MDLVVTEFRYLRVSKSFVAKFLTKTVKHDGVYTESNHGISCPPSDGKRPWINQAWICRRCCGALNSSYFAAASRGRRTS
jgi:hypothetical protein